MSTIFIKITTPFSLLDDTDVVNVNLKQNVLAKIYIDKLVKMLSSRKVNTIKYQKTTIYSFVVLKTMFTILI